jgi:hypothetical protein
MLWYFAQEFLGVMFFSVGATHVAHFCNSDCSPLHGLDLQSEYTNTSMLLT